mgnify:CR=1 FL=1
MSAQRWQRASQAGGNVDLYDRVLSELLHLADSDEKLLSLTSYVARNELRVNRELALAAMASWQKSPDRSGTVKALHFAALSDDADVYRGAVEQALTFWRERKLSDVSAIELRALFDGEFWILSSAHQEFRRWFCFEAHPRQRAPRTGSGRVTSAGVSQGNSNDRGHDYESGLSQKLEVYYEQHRYLLQFCRC